MLTALVVIAPFAAIAAVVFLIRHWERQEAEQNHIDFHPWWGDLCIREAEAERIARQQDALEAREFQARIDAHDTPDQAA